MVVILQVERLEDKILTLGQSTSIIDQAIMQIVLDVQLTAKRREHNVERANRQKYAPGKCSPK
jgi:hypothetical protein